MDINVFISAALKRGALPAIALLQATQRGVLLKSTVTEAQLSEVMARPTLARLIAPSMREWVAQHMATAELMSITERITACRDPTDHKFLELAVAGRADIILTGDKDLLVLDPSREIPTIQPAIFAEGAIQ